MIIVVPGLGPRRVPDNISQAKIDQIMAAANERAAKRALYWEWRQPDKTADIDAYLVTLGYEPHAMDGEVLSRARERVRLWKSGQIDEAIIVPPFNPDELKIIK